MLLVVSMGVAAGAALMAPWASMPGPTSKNCCGAMVGVAAAPPTALMAGRLLKSVMVRSEFGVPSGTSGYGVLPAGTDGVDGGVSRPPVPGGGAGGPAGGTLLSATTTRYGL